MDAAADPNAEEMPGFIQPMLAKLTTLPADESRWAFEVKWDGVRAIAHSQPGRISFASRAGNDITAAYPELRKLNDALGSHSAILDGEIVAFDDRGHPSFQALQTRMHVRNQAAVRRLVETTPVVYMIFDLLWLNGHSLTELPYTERRQRLAELKLADPRWSVPEYQRGRGGDLLAATREHGIEGVVGKRLDSRYAPGSRSAGWVKIKNSMRQELVIGGWTTGKGSRADSLGALHLGVHDQDGSLRYVGKVGTGFNADELSRLAKLLEPLACKTSPFAGRQPAKGARFVDPALVCEVEFSEWTHAGTLRQASYKGLRDDKPAADVVRERASEPETGSAVAAPIAADTSLDASAATEPHPHGSRADLAALIEAGHKVRGGIEIELEGRTLKLTNLDKVLYPKAAFTKADVISYYAAVAPVLLPHLHDRPLTLKRYPDGVDAQFFYEKRSPAHRPDWVQTVRVTSDRGDRPIDYTLCQDLPTLVWLANLADIELHPLLSRAADVRRPTAVAFDLDPGAPASIVECCEVALKLQALFEELGLRAVPKTSGSKGLQVFVPLNDPEVSYSQTKRFAHAVAALLEERHPKLILSAMAKARRKAKVLIDWSQNDEHKTTVGVYSLRATERPAVSTPIEWSEVRACHERGDRELLSFDPQSALSRAALDGDRFLEVLSLHQTLPKLED